MKFYRKGIVLAAFTLGFVNCTFFMPVDTLKNQASFEMKCPVEKMQFTPLAGDCDKKLANDYDCTIGVEGCGKQMTYIHVHKTNNWIANTSVQGR